MHLPPMNPIRKGILAFQRLIPNKFIRFLLQDYCARNPAQRNG